MPTKTSAATLVTSAETDLFATVVSDSYHSCKINLSPIAVGDEFVFRLYTYDETLAALDVELTIPKSGKQNDKFLRFNPVADSHFKITGQKIKGTDRTFNWTRWV